MQMMSILQMKHGVIPDFFPLFSTCIYDKNSKMISHTSCDIKIDLYLIEDMDSFVQIE